MSIPYPSLFFLLLLLPLTLSSSFLQLSSKFQLTRLFNTFPHFPSLVIYQPTTSSLIQHSSLYTKLHLSTSDYSLLLIINCQKNLLLQKKQQFQGCPAVTKYARDLAVVQGYIPNDNMLSIRGKMFRMVPGYVQNEVEREFEVLYDMVEGLVPNYIEKLYSEEDIKEFLAESSYLLPKVFLYTDGEQYTSLKKLAIHFQDRAKFAQVLVKQYSQNKLVLSHFDFSDKIWKQHTFPNKAGIKQYQNMKSFIEEYAVKRPMREEYDYLRIDNMNNYADDGNYTRVVYESMEKYTLVWKGKIREEGEKVLEMYKEKYGEFLNYILYISDETPSLYLTQNDQTKSLPLTHAQLEPFPTFFFTDIQKNAQNLMDLGNIVFLVQPKLDYLCSIQTLKVLSGFFNCFAVNQQDVGLVKGKFDIPNEDQMAILFSTDKEDKFVGKNLNNHTFQNVISITYNIVRNRIKALAKKFSANPIFPIFQDVSYSKICDNCFLYLHSNNPSSINLDNYKLQALEHNKQMPFYYGYYECNTNFFKEIGKEPQNILVFISKGQVFYTKEMGKGITGKIIKKWKQGGLKMKGLGEGVKSDQKCGKREEWKGEEGSDEL